jgi:HAMP domain-containing protein
MKKEYTDEEIQAIKKELDRMVKEKNKQFDKIIKK